MRTPTPGVIFTLAPSSVTVLPCKLPARFHNRPASVNIANCSNLGATGLGTCNSRLPTNSALPPVGTTRSAMLPESARKKSCPFSFTCR